MFSVAAAIGVVKKGLEEVGRIKAEAAARARESEFGYGSLAEVSQGDPEKFKQNVATARHIASTAGMSENQAARLTFALSSAGAMGEADTFAEAYKRGVVQDPETLLRSSTAMRKAYGGQMSNRCSWTSLLARAKPRQARPRSGSATPPAPRVCQRHQHQS